MVGVSSFFEDRSGGDISAMRFGVDSAHKYIERNESKRLNAQARLDGQYKNHGKYTLKSSVYSFRRTLQALDKQFSGRQISSYSELSYASSFDNNDVVLGVNVLSDSFSKKKKTATNPDYAYITWGAFLQDDWHMTDRITLQPAVRLDYHSRYHFQFEPHFSALLKLSNALTVRSFAGAGYRIPVIENLLSDRDLLNNKVVLSSDTRTERSGNVGADVTYKYLHGNFMATIDQSVFYTRVNEALIPDFFSVSDSARVVSNADSRIVSKGYDMNALLALDELSLFIDYTHSHVRKTISGQTSRLELTPEDKLNLTLSLEGEGKWRSGIEAFYTGRQYLAESDSFSRDYWTFGVMFEKIFRRFSIIGNVENVFDERQTKHQRVINPPFDNPTFKPLFEPLDGIVANIALRLNLQ